MNFVKILKKILISSIALILPSLALANAGVPMLYLAMPAFLERVMNFAPIESRV